MKTGNARRWWGLGALTLSALTLGLDLTILNVALATLSEELDASTSRLQWIVNSYALVFAALLLPAGLLGDRFGRKRLLLTGMALFGAASLAGAFADGAGQVIAARAAMGMGAAIMIPLTMAMLPVIFPPEERTRAVAIWSASMALGLPLGPLLGGWLLEHYWWGSIFLINVPVVAVAGIAVALLLPESRDPAVPRIDWTGAALSMAGLVALVYGVIEGPVRGWTDALTLGSAGAGLALLAVFAAWERRAAEPIMDIALFRERRFVWALVAVTTATVVLAGALFVLPQYLQVVQGNDVLGTGVRLIPMLAGLMVAGVVTERLSARLGPKPLMVTGLLLLAAGFGMGALTGAGDGYGYVALWLTIAGLGLGFTMIPAMDTVLAVMPEDRTGRGSGLVQSLRQTGAALGIAGLGSIVSSVYRDRFDPGALPEGAARTARDSLGGAAAVAERTGDAASLHSARDAYVQGMDAALAAGALGAAAVALLVVVFLPGGRPERRDAAGSSDHPESEHEHLAT